MEEIKSHQIKWLNNLQRMELTRLPKAVLNYHPREQRESEKPKRHLVD